MKKDRKPKTNLKTIKIFRDTHEMLHSEGYPGETFDSIIKRVLEELRQLRAKVAARR